MLAHRRRQPARDKQEEAARVPVAASGKSKTNTKFSPQKQLLRRLLLSQSRTDPNDLILLAGRNRCTAAASTAQKPVWEEHKQPEMEAIKITYLKLLYLTQISAHPWPLFLLLVLVAPLDSPPPGGNGVLLFVYCAVQESEWRQSGQ